jgi:hypothetical protein
VAGNCVLKKERQDPAKKLDYKDAFELDRGSASRLNWVNKKLEITKASRLSCSRNCIQNACLLLDPVFEGSASRHTSRD